MRFLLGSGTTAYDSEIYIYILLKGTKRQYRCVNCTFAPVNALGRHLAQDPIAR